MAHRDSNRPRRVGELLKRGLADVLRQEFSHPLSARITLTAIDMASDLRNAKVFFTIMGGESVDGGEAVDVKKLTAELNKASGYFRHCLRDRVELRGLPKLIFAYDTAVERGAHMEALFTQIHGDDKSEH